MGARNLEEHGWRSTLDDYPAHVRAIGMISIENANLELAMARLFSQVALISLRVARAVYLTPKSAIARLEIIQSAAKASFRPNGDDSHKKQLSSALNKVNRIAERAKTIAGKRHSIIHDVWSVDDDTGEVQRSPVTNVIMEENMPLATLERLIDDLRRLISDVHDLSEEFHHHPPTMVDMRLRQPDKNLG